MAKQTAVPVVETVAQPTKLKYAFHPPTVERFFDKAQANGIPVTIYTHDGKTHENVLPIAKVEGGYKVKNGRVQTIPATMIARFEYVQPAKEK